jgi:regulation of enolase protein 1 (concanavalin A-like superfamily)
MTGIHAVRHPKLACWPDFSPDMLAGAARNRGFLYLESHVTSQSMRPILSAFYWIIATGFFMLQTNAYGQEPVRIPAINKDLTWEIKPVSFSVQGNAITIAAGEKTDMFRDPNVTYNTDNAPKLMFNPDQDFVLIAGIEHGFVHKWDGGAIVLKQDSLHWVKFCFEKDYTGARRVVSVVTKDVSDDCNSVEIPSDKVFYKVAKADNVITLYYSLDGNKWFLVRHLQFDAPKGWRVGFLAQSPTGTSCTVRFSDIRYEAKKIKDPYAGE